MLELRLRAVTTWVRWRGNRWFLPVTIVMYMCLFVAVLIAGIQVMRVHGYGHWG